MSLRNYPIQEVRRSNLRNLIKERFEGKISLAADCSGKPASVLSSILANPSRKSFGERLARDIEKALGLIPLWFDQGESIIEKSSLSLQEDLFLLSVRAIIENKIVPAHVMQTVIFLLDAGPNKSYS